MIFVSFFCCRVTPTDGETSPSGAPGCSDGVLGATGGTGAMAMPATSTLSLPISQGKPSLRRIKGRIHRSKSLDSIDLLDTNVSLTHDLITAAYICAHMIVSCLNILFFLTNSQDRFSLISNITQDVIKLVNDCLMNKTGYFSFLFAAIILYIVLH